MNNFYQIIEYAIKLRNLNEKEQILRTVNTKSQGKRLVEKVDKWIEENYNNNGIDKELENELVGSDREVE